MIQMRIMGNREEIGTLVEMLQDTFGEENVRLSRGRARGSVFGYEIRIRGG